MSLDALLVVIAFVLGACFGSFFNVIICRLPREESIVRPGSHCMKCGKPVRWYDNIPIVSYFILRGKCRDCGEPFSIRYSIVELLTAALFAMVAARYVGSISDAMSTGSATMLLQGVGMTVVHFAFVAGLVIAAFIDIDHQIIPNEITFSGIPIGIAASTLFPVMQGADTHFHGFLLALISAAACGGGLFLIGEVASRILKKEAMGFGDVKLLALLGAFMGWKLTCICLFFASLSGAVVGVTLIQMKKVEWQSRIPFGPYIVLGALISYFWGNDIFDWYWGFFRTSAGL